MTIREIKIAVASFLNTTEAGLTINSQDLGLLAINHVRQEAEMNHNFEFGRKLATVTVNGSTGVSLDSAVVYGTATPVDIKSVIDVGYFDTNDNLRPIEWTTVAESLDRQREDLPNFAPRYPTDGEVGITPVEGGQRILMSGSQVYLFPKDATASVVIGMEVYTFTTDWVTANLVTEFSPWTTKGSQYLIWSSVVYLNNYFHEFLFRQEGNLPPPEKMVEKALASFITWDALRYEQYRRRD